MQPNCIGFNKHTRIGVSEFYEYVQIIFRWNVSYNNCKYLN